MDTSAGATVAFATAVLAVSVGWLLLGSRKRVPTQPAKPPPALAPETKRGPMLVLWGSQTGTAEGFATTLEREACERGFAAQAMDLEEYDVTSLASEPGVVIFLMSTHGEGEPPDNAVAFHAWLSSADRAAGEMSEVRYGAFALGNKQYDKFCAMGVWVDGRMAQLGAARVHDLGLGDDDDDLEADFERWRRALWAALGAVEADGDEAVRPPAPCWEAVFVGGCAARGSMSDDDDDDDDIIDDAGWAAEWGGSPCGAPSEMVSRFAGVLALAGDDDDGDVSGGGGGGKAGKGGECRILPLHAWMAAIHPKLGATPVHVLVNRELQATGSAESTRHVELALAPPTSVPPSAAAPPSGALGLAAAAAAGAFRGARALRYAAADDAGIYPQNSRDAVRRAAALLRLRLGALFELARAHDAPASAHAPPFPTPCTVGRALRWFVDLSAPPSKAFLAQLARYCADGAEAAALRELASDARSAEYTRWAVDGRRNLLDALAAAPSASLPLGALFELAPKLHPRYYTIASSPLAAPSALHLTVKLLAEPACRAARAPEPLRDARARGAEDARFAGVCSAYLAAARDGGGGGGGGAGGANGYVHAQAGGEADLVLAFVKSSNFRLPPLAETPIVMVGAGTGVAPFRALVQELAHRREPLPTAAMLYFGCQAAERDFLYADELLPAVGAAVGAPLARAADGRAGWEAIRPESAAGPACPLSRLRVAFSRAEPARKLYVQHLLEADARILWNLLEPADDAARGAHVFVCGGTAMGRAVVNALAQIARSEGGMSATEANEWVHDLEKQKRLVKELWA
ncbi:hypothetical protein KFE25_012386 [Diacronema lutheri]|uniref:NADPH--hemoprotein reductase n=3 Tax=Diacronema lutheri TaxID=2081491 RepID=A0A8J6CEW9_DIALT|nr:hypothetical protein KFE25_012386 [Diacronema lutheri]